jgi:hypothetical protein
LLNGLKSEPTKFLALIVALSGIPGKIEVVGLVFGLSISVTTVKDIGHKVSFADVVRLV